MIRYKSDLFGLRTLYVWNGSATFRAFLPALLSTGLLLLYHYVGEDTLGGRNMIEQPYTITVLITFFSFLLTIRLNYSYQRYWEAATQVHQMTSKWLDSAICLASLHYQCRKYDKMRPPTFGKNPNTFNETRERERMLSQTLEATQKMMEEVSEQKNNSAWFWNALTTPFYGSKKQTPKPPPSARRPSQQPKPKTFKPNRARGKDTSIFFVHHTTGLHGGSEQPPENTKEWSSAFAAGKGKNQSQKICQLTGLESMTPSLFLQEAAHLYSLLSAVAMATLRNDIDGAESPLAEYIPGRPFPPVNPDELTSDIKRQYHQTSRFWTSVYFVLGISRSDKQRTLYNAARPFRVIVRKLFFLSWRQRVLIISLAVFLLNKREGLATRKPSGCKRHEVNMLKRHCAICGSRNSLLENI